MSLIDFDILLDNLTDNLVTFDKNLNVCILLSIMYFSMRKNAHFWLVDIKMVQIFIINKIYFNYFILRGLKIVTGKAGNWLVDIKTLKVLW